MCPLLILFVLLIKSQQSENRYCQEAVDSVKIVSSCPTSKKEWDIAAQKKNCIRIAFLQNCSSVEQFEYHCVINGYRNETLEVCAPSRIIFGHCVEFNVPGGVIQDQISAACSETFPKCDASYLSSSAYKYPDCYKLVSMSATKLTITATNSDESNTPKSMTVLYFTLACMSFVILIVAIYIVFLKKTFKCCKKKLPKGKKENKKNEIGIEIERGIVLTSFNKSPAPTTAVQSIP